MNTSMKRFLNPAEAAAYIGLKKQTIAFWRHSNAHPELSYIKVGGAIRYRKEDLDAWLKLQTVGTKNVPNKQNQQASTNDNCLSQTDVAYLLNVSLGRVSQMMHSGMIEFVGNKKGKKQLVTVTSVIQLLQRRTKVKNRLVYGVIIRGLETIPPT